MPLNMNDQAQQHVATLGVVDQHVATLDVVDQHVGTLDVVDQHVGTLDVVDQHVGTLDVVDQHVATLDVVDQHVATLDVVDQHVGTLDVVDQHVATLDVVDQHVATLDDADQYVVTLDLVEPPDDELVFARQNIGETPDSRVCSVQELMDVIYERGDVQPHRMDDAFLLRFLRARHFQVEKAYQLMVNYYQFKKDNPDYHEGVYCMSDELVYISNEEIITALPYRDQHGRRTTIVSLGKWDTSLCSMDDILRATLFLLEVAVLEPRAQILGAVVFFDLENLSMDQAWQFTPTVVNKVIQLTGGSFPIRVQEFHILNEPWVFNKVFALFKPFLGTRSRSRIHFHGSDYESLHQHVDPGYLPERYGGTRKNCDNSAWIKSLEANQEVVDEMLSLGYLRGESPASSNTRRVDGQDAQELIIEQNGSC